ncbi:MAG TPA: polysaccharide lyase family protein [Terriglobia bacterium]|nr:polysaccharide lyase family protein [Terriglobia bacterium]
MTWRLPIVFFTLAFLEVALAGKALSAAEQTVWEIGQFDQSSAEFHHHVDFSNPNDNPIFTVGKSDPSKDWPAAQPGSANSDAGARPHPYTIIFDLTNPPRGAYHLEISVVLNRPRVPNLQVDINGKSGVFYLHRKVSYYPGDGGVDSPIYGGDHLTMALPTAAFRAGENKLVLTAVDDPKDGPGDSWLLYDALRLVGDADAKAQRSTEISIDPTIFYAKADGELSELTHVTVTHSDPVQRGEVTLTVAGKTLKADIPQGHDFGEERVEFAVPEVSSTTEAEATVHLDGHTLKSRLTFTPRRKWNIDLAPHAHLDIGFTDYQAKIAEIHNRNLDRLLDEIEAHPEMRFNLDGSWIVQQYLASRNQATQERLLKLVHEGKIAVPVQLANLMTGYPTLEELIRSTDYTHDLHEHDGFPFDYANITDVPSYTWSYPSVLAALGVKYFSAAANSDRGPILLYGRWNTKAPFWWEGPDGQKVLMSYSRQYSQLWFVCGIPPQEANCRQALPTFFQQYDSPAYKPDTVLMFGSQFENTYLVPGEREFVEKWDAQYAYPRIQLATFPDFMRYVDQHYGSELETVKGDGGPYWEDGYGTDVHYLTIDRESQQRAPSAEKLSTIATYFENNVSGPAGEVRAMWNDLVLYAEHTFTSWGGYSRPQSQETVRQFEVKDNFAVDGRLRVNAILDQSLSQLADKIHVPATAFVVFNPLNWTRTDLVETDLDAGDTIVEYPGKAPVPFEVLAKHSGYDHVRFLAREVPSLGYRCYQVVQPHQHGVTHSEQAALPASNAIENAYYRIEVDPEAGAIKSIFDKQLNRDIVDASSPYRFNQYLYVSGGNGETQLVYLRKSLPLAKLTVTGSSGGRITGVRRTPYGQVLSYETSGPHAPSIATDIILYDDQKRIDLVNRVHKEPVNVKEAVYFAFPVAAENPRFSYEIQNGWVDPARDMLKGANVAWFTVQHWVKVASGNLSVAMVPIDSPLITLGDIVRGTWPEEFEPKAGTIFSYAMNNYWHTNFRRVQSGDFTFRYAVTSGPDLPPAELARFGRAAMTPLEMGELVPNDKFDDPERPLPPDPSSFLEIDAPDVVVVNWKAADDGKGTIVRLLEAGGATATAHLTFPMFNLERAWRCNAAEENQQALNPSGHSLAVDLKPHEIATLRIIATMSRAAH